MNRRDFLRRSALIAAGAVAADQLELLERLAPRRLWAGWTAPAQPKNLFELKAGHRIYAGDVLTPADGDFFGPLWVEDNAIEAPSEHMYVGTPDVVVRQSFTRRIPAPRVGPAGPVRLFGTLQEAVDAAQAGDRIVWRGRA